MPFIEASQMAGKKRKRTAKIAAGNHKTARLNENSNDIDSEIQRLEIEISQSRKHFNNIVKLLDYAFPKEGSRSHNSAAIALCRTFCRLLADGSLKHGENMTKAESAVLKWLEEKYREYTSSLLGLFIQNSQSSDVDPLRLIMRLVKQEVSSFGNNQWAGGIFAQALRAILAGREQCADVRSSFVKSYFKYDDVRYYTLAIIP
jgi:U3 small nucleolar RNA-associated protein 19